MLAATDPAQPYGATLAWPESPGRPARIGAAVVVLRDGLPLAWYDRRSHHLVTFPHTHDDRAWAEALADLVRGGRVRRVEIRKVDGEPLATSPVDAEVTAAAEAAGFTDGYQGLQFTARLSHRAGAASTLTSSSPGATNSTRHRDDRGRPGRCQRWTPRRPAQARSLTCRATSSGSKSLAALDEAAAGPLGQADEGVGERQAVLVVDVGGDERGDGLRHRRRDPAHGAAELLVAARRRCRTAA